LVVVAVGVDVADVDVAGGKEEEALLTRLT
jgi:hypothetical protein